ncbi:MAG TPA: PAS domain S-box protein [Dehalococcoidia bacterium]|nr:PAS domain S-box protein [Dehalococcoidia bacterium]
MSWPNDERDLAWQVVAEAGDAIVVADREGVIRFWNRRAEEIFGYSSQEALGQTLDIIVPERHRERHWEGYRRVMATGQTKYGRGELLSVPALRKDGSRLSVEFTITLLKGQDGRVQGIAAIMRDVSERWQQERALRERLAELEARLAQLS